MLLFKSLFSHTASWVPFKHSTSTTATLTLKSSPNPPKPKKNRSLHFLFVFFSSLFSLSLSMAENADDGVFWLPSEFLSDDDDDKPVYGNSHNTNNVTSFFNNDAVSGAMFTYLSSSETESSDEEEHMTELTRRLAHSTLELELNRNSLPSPKPKGVVVSGSPQSTLCGCGGKGGSSSSQGSPNSACHVTSQRATWDLLRAAAGEVERMRLSDAGRRRFSHNHTTSLVVPHRNHSNIVGFNNNNHHQHSLSPQQLQIAQFEMLRQQQMAKQKQHQQQQGSVPVWCAAPSMRGRDGEFVSVVGGGRNANAVLCASAWPPLQRHAKQQQHRQYGSGMRAVFLGNPSGKRESTGTGVFLPRRIDGPVESKKKPACSTVLVPARVAQALNLKLEDMVPQQPHQPRFNGISNMENAASNIPRLRSNYGFSQQKRNNLRPQPPVNHEIRLPQEWTY